MLLCIHEVAPSLKNIADPCSKLFGTVLFL